MSVHQGLGKNSLKEFRTNLCRAAGIAFFEYCFQVPANRIGNTVLSLPQLKILQEAITLVIFVPFAVLYMGTPITLDFLWAAICILAAVYFVFRA